MERTLCLPLRCQELPGQELFQYLDEEDRVCDITSTDVNEYLRKISGRDITAKDFRTWAGTMLAALALQEFETFGSQTLCDWGRCERGIVELE